MSSTELVWPPCLATDELQLDFKIFLLLTMTSYGIPAIWAQRAGSFRFACSKDTALSLGRKELQQGNCITCRHYPCSPDLSKLFLKGKI